jgi:DNA-binding NarL/FixJ family response regulator
MDISEDLPSVRVAIVDDHEVVRLGLKNLIDHQPDLEVVGDYGTA